MNIYDDKDADLFAAAIEAGDPVRDFFGEADILEALRQALVDLRYLAYFYHVADFGPAHADVVAIIDEEYDREVPDAWKSGEYEEEEE